MYKHKRHFFQSIALSVGALWASLTWAQSLETAAVARHYAQLVYASYEDTLAEALAMQQAIEAFLAQPSARNLASARTSWLSAREWYGQTEAFRFYAGPIDGENGPEARLNAWPLDESYIDGVISKPGSGIIHNPKFLISKANLAQLNQRNGEENIATGWHAIEFLLWGQDLNEDGPGNRSFEDFVNGKKPNAERRRQYLKVVTQLLIDDLRILTQAWRPATTNYRASFEVGDIESIRKIIFGLGSMSRGELAGERMEVALNTYDQEDEQSCFSDNTHRDIVTNALGIQNVWLGRFVRRDGSVLQGPSVRDLVAAKDATLAQGTTRDIVASVAAAQAVHAPFDREVKDGQGRARIQAAIDRLVQQTKGLSASAAVLGISRLNMAN